MNKPAETSLEYLRGVVDGGFTVMPRWTSEPVAGVAEFEETIPGDLVATLRQRAKELNVTFESVLLSAHAKVLGALSGEQEVVTGYVTVEGRQPLPCRQSIEPESWRSLIEDTHRLEAELLTHKDFQVDDLKSELGLTEPMFETVFDPTGQGQGSDFNDDTVFSVSIFPGNDQLVLRLRYQTEDVDGDFATRIAGYHLAALSLIAADPNAEHKRQSLLTAEELNFQIEGLAGPKYDLPESRFHELFEEQVRARPDAVAGVFGEQRWTYAELNARANQLGHALLERGLRRENVVAVVTERNLDWMAAVIGIFKAGGVYLPVEPHFPSDRIATMFTRAECKFVVTEAASTSTLDPALESLSGIQVIFVEKAYQEENSEEDLGGEVGPEQSAYVYFTSGSTGEPKGAMCEHEGMVNHLYAKINDLGVEEGGVVSQIAPQCFDISLWQLISGLMVGGQTLIVGQEVILDIPRFVDTVIDGKVTVMQVVPSYLDVILNYLDENPREFPDLKCVSVTGEAVTMELVERWFAAKPDIKLANAYGLTETSDDTNHEVMTKAPDGDRVPLGPAVINVFIYVVDQHLSPVPLGAPGEIVFSGVCVGRGYLNDPERTKAAFMEDPIRKGERLYRSGDFGCWRTDGKLEFLGRRDAQVKISGFRIEIGDIENALLAAPGINQGAVVIGLRPDKSKRLVAFYASDEPLDIPNLQEQLGQAIPDYMVPSTFHWQESLPLTANGKINRKQLTALAAELGAEEKEYIAPTTPTEEYFCEVLSGLMKVEQVSVEGHFFNDLGADSLTMAGFLAGLSKREDLPPVDIKDIYQNPTVRGLAVAVTVTESGNAPAVGVESAPPPEEAVEPVSTFQYVMCGVLQLLSAISYVFLLVLGSHLAWQWIFAGSGFVGILGRLMLAGSAGFSAMCILPILAKWVLVGRWKPEQFRVWSLMYFRFWLVKTLTRFNPLVLFVGSPIFTWYLRMLGAKIGKDAVILSPHIPVCSDLLTIGDNAVVCKDSFYHCYSARNGQIHTGPVAIGENAFVGEMTVLDIGSLLGDGAQLGHSSSLHAGQQVPEGEHRCGSPALQQTPVDYRSVEPADCSTARKVAYSACLLVGLLALSALLITITITEDIIIVDYLNHVVAGVSEFSQSTFYVDALLISLLFFVVPLVVGLIFVVTVPRLLNLFIKPDKVYPIYGWHYWVCRTIARTSNVKFFTHLFGDSSYIVYYLRGIGYDLSQNVVQTGSNFGSVVKHDNPLLVSVGTGTVIADGLSSVNNDYSNGSFRTSRVTIGSDSFLGNAIVYPSQGRVGDNCLLATKVMVPMDGDVLEGVGILGSPNFEIPRTVQRDKELSEGDEGELLEQKLSLKNKHNLVTIGLFLLSQWFLSFLVITIFLAAAVLYPTVGVSIFVAALLLTIIVRTGHHILVDRASMLFRSIKPRQCSIYDPHFWSHERFWKFMALRHHLAIFDGTPLKSFIWRLLGVSIGKRVFDDGCYITEKTLVSIGDGCTLGSGSIIQGHSQEDGGFKSDYIKIGAGCTLGVNAFVHYGVTMGDGAQLASDSFLMKGAEVQQHTRWGGNPASQTRSSCVPQASTEPTTSSSKTATDSASTVSQG